MTKPEGKLIWISTLYAGDLRIPQNGTFNRGHNTAKRAARAAAKAMKKARKRQPPPSGGPRS